VNRRIVKMVKPTPAELLDKRAAKLRKKLSGKKSKKSESVAEEPKGEEKQGSEEKITRQNVNEAGTDGEELV